MKCAEIKKLLPDYSVGLPAAPNLSACNAQAGVAQASALSKKKRELVKQHIDSCPECIRELRHLDKTASLLGSIPQEEPPDFLWEGIRREIIQQKHSTETLGIKFQSIWQGIMGWLWEKRIPALATGLAVLILVAGLYFAPWKSTTESESTLYAEMEQQTFSYWNSPFADRAALGMLVIKTSMEGEDNGTFR